MKINALFSSVTIGILTAIATSTMVIAKPIPNTEGYTAVNRLSQLKDGKKAIARYTQVIKENPNNADAYYQRGIVRSELQDYQGALADFNQVLRLNPKHSQALHRRGKVREQLNDADGAASDYTRAVQTMLERVR